ncbi:DUF938 domain-containing protein [Sphingomonas gilva]|uniref:DUF938 domain-containing protein n=1 Tax=Sphingomonas gilva TaxID=2305907 RepID=A0A396RN36_9SPHN|nr:DUF938 domain-containing protein [Sphingomonas gilva]RHW17877.1 DUF938 domain-containing protein [Sphingomonas gilva]
MSDPRRHAPATSRNRDPILAVLRDALPASGVVLEIASGSGEHAAHFAPALPGIVWQPSDPDAAARESTAAWTAGIANVRAPLALDAASADWPVAAADALVCINMIHIAPWAACEGLMAGAGRILQPCAPLVLYGPFRRAEVLTAPSNETFDASLKARDPSWGLRDLEAVSALAAVHGLRFDRAVEMPANNLSLIYRR